MSNFRPWKTVKVGTGLKPGPTLFEKLHGAQRKVADWAYEFLMNEGFDLGISPIEREVDLVAVSIVDLGFTTESVTREEIYKRALELGLQLCTPEIAIQLAFVYQEQPPKEIMPISMKPLENSRSEVFCLSRVACGCWFTVASHGPKSLWYPENKWIFELPRK